MTEAEASFDRVRVIKSSRPFSLKLGELWQYRELLYFLVWRDVKVRYKQTVLGAAWAVIQPVTAMIIFSIIFGRFANIPSNGLPYPVFVYAGLLAWLYFQQSLMQSSASIVGNAQLVTKVYFPRLVIPLASVASPVVDFGIALTVLLALMAWYGQRDSEIHHWGGDRRERDYEPREVDLRHELGVADDAGAALRERLLEVEPGEQARVHEHRIRQAVRRNIREPAEDDREDDHRRDRLNNRPGSAQDRLLVAHFDVTPHEEVQELAVLPELTEPQRKRARRLDHADAVERPFSFGHAATMLAAASRVDGHRAREQRPRVVHG